MLKRGLLFLLVFVIFLQSSLAQDSCLLPSEENAQIVAQRILQIYSQIYDDENKAVEAAIDSVNRWQPSENVDSNWVKYKSQVGNEMRRISTAGIRTLQEEKVVHSTFGSIYSWKGLYNKDYAPRTNEIFNELRTDTSNVISGGFNQDPRFFSHLGMYVDITPEDKINTLLEQFKGNIDNQLLPTLQSLLRDNPSYIILEHFLKEGGEIIALPGSSGHGRYTSDPLVILVGIGGSSSDTEKTLYHESLHYAFDKMDSILSESHDFGGADHDVIKPLDDRLRIIQQTNEGQIPIYDENNHGLYGFTIHGKIGEFINGYIDNNDLDGLKDYINSYMFQFQRGYVKSSMISPLSSKAHYDEHPEEREGRYRLTDGQIIDIAFLNAINGAIIQQAINIGISIANEKSIKITEAFETKEFQDKFQKFISQFATELENPSIQPYTVASKIFIEDL